MKENLTKIMDKVKSVWTNLKNQLKKINFINKIVELARAHRLVLAIGFFCIAMLTLILIPTLVWSEFVVPVCVLMVLEVSMAVMLHRSELWIHAILLILHVVLGIAIARIPMMIICVAAYLVSTLTLQLAFKKLEK